MSAIMHQRQSIQGFEIGASLGLSILVTLITAAFVGMNGYHMSNYLVAKLTTSDTTFMISVFWYAIGYGVAALEIPLGMSFITNYRLHGFWHMGTFSQLFLAVLVAALAAAAGIGSQLADAETRANQLTAHSTTLSGFGNAAKSAEMTRDMQILAAERLRNPTDQQIAKLNAERNYQRALQNIAQSTSSAQTKKPLKIMESDSAMQTAIFSLLSLVASFGAFYLSCFKAVYIEQLIGHIAFSLKAKSNHEWESDASDFRTKQHELSPLKNRDHGVLFKEKVPAKTIKQAPQPAAETDRPNPSIAPETDDQVSPSSDDKTDVKCPACDSVFVVNADLLEPTNGNPKGLLRCGECRTAFDGKAHIVPTPNEDTDDLKKPENSPIPEEFAGNSQGIRLENQEVASAENSTGIPQKFAENSTRIPERLRKWELMPNSSKQPRQVDLSKVAKIDGTEAKLKGLAETIDALAANPESDGLLFSPTKTFKELHLNYVKVQEVFQLKQREGKISQTKPYKIIYRETV